MGGSLATMCACVGENFDSPVGKHNAKLVYCDLIII